MSQYLLSVHSAKGEVREQPSPEQMQEFMQRVVALEAEMEATGTFVFGGRLSEPGDATVVRRDAGGVLFTDGPFAESKEVIAGFYIIDAADVDEARAWAEKVVAAIDAPIEVRPFQATGYAKDHIPAGP